MKYLLLTERFRGDGYLDVLYVLKRISYYWHWIRFHLIRFGPSHGIAVLFDNISQEVCFLGRKFFSPPGQSLSSKGVGCSGGGVWLEQGKREEKKEDGVCKTSCGRSAAS